MALTLVIAEKPSVAQTIAAALGIKGKQDGYIEGGGYLISWCVGHLVQLAEAAAYGEQYKKWSFDSLPILPEEWQYAVDPDKGKQFKTIKELMHHADAPYALKGFLYRIITAEVHKLRCHNGACAVLGVIEQLVYLFALGRVGSFKDT